MVEPKLEIEKRMDRIEKAVETIAHMLAGDSTIGFDAYDHERIQRILNMEQTADVGLRDETTD